MNALRRLATWPIRLTVSGALLYLVLQWVPVDGIAISLLSADPRLATVAYALTIPVVLLSVLQLQLLFDTTKTPIRFSQLLRIHLTTEFWGLFVPSYLSSGALRFYRLSQAGSPVMRTTSVILFRRLIDAAVVALLGCFFWTFVPLVERNLVVAPWVLVAVAAILLIFHFLFFNNTTSAWVRKFLEDADGSNAQGKFRRNLLELIDSQEMLAQMPWASLLRFVGIVIIRNFANVATFLAMAVSLYLPISFFGAGFVWAIVRLLKMLPITIAGLGLREVSLLILLSSPEVTNESIVALGVLLLSRDILIKLAGGFLELYNVCGTRFAKSAAKENQGWPGTSTAQLGNDTRRVSAFKRLQG